MFFTINKQKEDMEFLMSLLPKWTKGVPKDLDPTFYGAGTYEVDLEVKKKIDEIRERYKKKED